MRFTRRKSVIMSEKIPCSVGILTLNSGQTLRTCLESVETFAEIIICDGNSTDNTLAIAREYGAKIVKQYDSEKPNLSCVKDKATVRTRNMEAATYDWYFFMDSDDALPSEITQEVRRIVENQALPYSIYRMPSRIYIAGRLIKYASVYPAYQIRLFRRSTGARFKGEVHDHIDFDRAKYQLGEMKSFYHFYWPAERAEHFWAYQKKYAEWEVAVVEFESLPAFLYWAIYRRLRLMASFIFFRIPRTYLLHGFKDSLPFKFEFLVLWQHCYILYLFILRGRSLIKSRKHGYHEKARKN